MRMNGGIVEQCINSNLIYLKENAVGKQIYDKVGERGIKLNPVYAATYQNDICPISIDSYRDKGFTLDGNGFDIYNFYDDEKMKHTLDVYRDTIKYNEDPYYRSKLREDLKEFMIKYARKKTIAFDNVIIVDAVFRDTCDEKSLFKAVPVVHVDFSQEKSFNYFLEVMWADRIKNAMKGKYSDIGNINDPKSPFWNTWEISTMLNVWISLSDKIEEDPLAVMDIKSLKKEQVFDYVARRNLSQEEFDAVGVTYDKDNKWYYIPQMPLGTSLIFNTRGTPHAAFKLNNTTKCRKSVECRCIFIKKKE